VLLSIFVSVGDRDFKLDTSVHHSKYQPIDDIPSPKRAWSVSACKKGNFGNMVKLLQCFDAICLVAGRASGF